MVYFFEFVRSFKHDRLRLYKKTDMKTFKLIVTFLILGVFSVVNAQEVAQYTKKADAFFKTYVKNGLVDYKAIKNNKSSLEELIKLGEGISVSENDKLNYQSFWINAYNVNVIKGIVDNFPINSPLDIKGFFDQTKYTVGGKYTTLNDIENKLLRAVFPKEARFHFVLVCAGLGCPPIIAEAYTPNMLESQLQKQTELALNNPDFIRVKGKKVQISQIFEWYKGDFTQDGNEVDFINKFRKEPLPAKAKVSYYQYNWKLNITK